MSTFVSQTTAQITGFIFLTGFESPFGNHFYLVVALACIVIYRVNELCEIESYYYNPKAFFGLLAILGFFYSSE